MASQSNGLHRHGNPPGDFMLALPSIESRFETEELRLPPIKKKEAAKARWSLHLSVLEFLELVLQSIKCLFCMLIQMPADFQFHFGKSNWVAAQGC
jgi:hypothetical protein